MKNRSYQGRLTEALKVIKEYDGGSLPLREGKRTPKLVSAAMRTIASVCIDKGANDIVKQRATESLASLARRDDKEICILLMSSIIRVEERALGIMTPAQRRASEHNGGPRPLPEFEEVIAAITD